MSNDNDDLDKMGLDELRELKEEVLSCIDVAGMQTALVDAEKITAYYELLREIEARLDKFEKGGS